MVFFDLLLAVLLRAIRGLLAAGRRVITIVFLSSGAVQSGELVACRFIGTRIRSNSTLKRFCICMWWHAFEGWHGNSSWGCFWNFLMCISELVCGSFRNRANWDSSGLVFLRECAMSSALAIIQEPSSRLYLGMESWKLTFLCALLKWIASSLMSLSPSKYCAACWWCVNSW